VPRHRPEPLQSLLALTGGAPAASLVFVTFVVASLLALYAAPMLVERNLFRPYWWLRPGRRSGQDSELFTPVSSAFLHADLPHLLFNGFTFWAFAFPLERAIGSGRFASLYAFGLLVSTAGTWWRHRRNPNYRTLGASGAITAVLFASIVYVPQASIFMFPIPVPIPAPIFAVLYVAYSVWASRQQAGGINHDAHLGGAVAGVAFVALTDFAAMARALRYVAG